MKIIKKPTLLLLLLMALISACSSTKMKSRHYQQWSEVASTKIEEENTEKIIVYIEPNSSLETEILNESISIHKIIPAETADLIGEKVKIDNASSFNKLVLKQTINKTTIPDYSLFDMKFKQQVNSSLFSSPVTSDLSLLWIVIIILLVLWALGLIAGNFGGLIHLLLVIALILLILWLLRII
jgi:hypothetical protein